MDHRGGATSTANSQNIYSLNNEFNIIMYLQQRYKQALATPSINSDDPTSSKNIQIQINEHRDNEDDSKLKAARCI